MSYYFVTRNGPGSPASLDLILPHMLHMDSVKRPLKPMSMEACFTTPAIPIRSTSGSKKMWGRIRLSKPGFMTLQGPYGPYLCTLLLHPVRTQPVEHAQVCVLVAQTELQ